jgi:2-polyprenyl-6-methoxyphenol hydroxylase-like FAD-dependent oxidoreductase
MRILVVGGGIGGLATALTLGRRGHQVVVVERDDTPMPSDADEAFEWDRRGAPQVRHSHALLARLRNLLLGHYPDVYASLLEAGASEMRFGDNLPPTIEGFEAEPGDEELVLIAARRTTFEWVLRQAALAEPGVEIITGRAAVGLLGGDGHARGVILDDETELAGDLVVLASGRRIAVDEWLVDIGGRPVVEAVDDTGIVYFSRFYRLRDGQSPPPRSGLIGGDLGYLKYGVFIGDNQTFSITLAVPTSDSELRRALTDPTVFDTAARQFTAAADWLDGRSVAITDQVHSMAGLLNRWRDYVVDSAPVAHGVVAVGDAIVCTNPLYGRGCSTAFWSAQLLAEVIDTSESGATGSIELEYHIALVEQLKPWYLAALNQDTEAKRVAAAILAGEDPDGDTSDPRTFMRAVFREGLAPAMRTDPVVLRAVMRTMNLLASPESLLTDPEVSSRVLSMYNDREHRPPEPELGPRARVDLLATIGV